MADGCHLEKLKNGHIRIGLTNLQKIGMVTQLAPQSILAVKIQNI